MQRRLVSLIICTRDRAESLRQTLQAIDGCLVPDGMAVEILVVDNGSRDRTRSVVRQAKCWGRSPRYLFEPRPGQAIARNTAIAAAQGEVLLWTDDDVRPGGRWIEAMCRPLLSNEADAAAGCIRLPEYLERAWLQPWHRVCLAVDGPTCGDFNLTGANMAFTRRVLEKVPAFDEELGPGALGFSDDTLYSLHLRTAGYRLLAAGPESVVEHHCGEDRLTRAALAEVFAGQGRSQAYVDYHWLHRNRPLATLRGGKFRLGLAGLGALRRLGPNRSPIIGRWEARWIWRSAYYDQLLIESGRPRQYTLRGLEKLVPSIAFPQRQAAAATAQTRRAA